MTDLRARAQGALYGLAIGDALGMPTQMLPRRLIQQRLPAWSDFLPGLAENPLSVGLPAGRVTDDTEQALLLAEVLLAGQGRIDAEAFLGRLSAWARSADERQLGPSTRAALEAYAAGLPPAVAGRHGATNGAAMRITPIGIATPPEPLERLLDQVESASSPTHGTGLALAAAAAVAAAVSTALIGHGFPTVLAKACQAAALAQLRGTYHAGPSVADRIAWAVALMDPEQVDASLDKIDRLVGTGVASQESVPAAFALVALSPEDPWQACLRAASLGGDSDTIGALAGAIGGALVGEDAFPAAARQRIEAVNHLDLPAWAERLLALRIPMEGE